MSVAVAGPDPLELEALAKLRERRNQPWRLLAVSLLLSVVGVGFGLVARAGTQSAAAQLRRAQRDQQRVEQLAQAHALLRQASSQDWTKLYAPFPLFRTTLQTLAQRAGLEAPRFTDPPNLVLPDSPLRIQTIQASFARVELSALLRWLTLAQQEIDRLEVLGLDLQPGDEGWSATCKLGRWEVTQ